jgi:hypothetical protein
MERKARFHKAGKASASTSIVRCSDVYNGKLGATFPTLKHFFIKGDFSDPVN